MMDLDEPGNIRPISEPIDKGFLCEDPAIKFHISRGIGMALEMCYLNDRYRCVWVTQRGISCKNEFIHCYPKRLIKT